MTGNHDGNFLRLEQPFGKIHHNCDHYTTIEIFHDRNFCDFKHPQIFTKNSLTNKFLSPVH